MTNAYRWVQWNSHKRTYDLILITLIVTYLGCFVGVGMLTHSPPNQIDLPILLIRGLSTLAFLLLHIILCIGPISRWTDLAAPLLYNRRHLGVAFFVVALFHAVLATLYYGGFGLQNPVSAIFLLPTGFNKVSSFPFEFLGLFALVIFFAMAATSHDFWLANLGHRTWKALHMLVYLAYGLVVAHVLLGALQSETSPIYAVVVAIGVACVSTLHLLAGLHERARDHTPTDPEPAADADGWIVAATIDEIAEGSAKLVSIPNGERIALYRHENGFRAVSNVCAHQGGPLAEGQIVGGCITCPWHGYQYNPEDGCSPPPYTEKIPTFDVRIEGRSVLLNPDPNPPGTPTKPAPIPDQEGGLHA